MAETPEEVAARIVESPYFAYRPVGEIASALRAQYVAGLEAAARVADDEATAYQENAIACDRSGNIHGGTMDSVGVCASRRIADAIRELAEQAKEK